jgi:hypothetical protein
MHKPSNCLTLAACRHNGQTARGGEAEGEAPPRSVRRERSDLEAKTPKCYIRAKREQSRQQDADDTKAGFSARHANYACQLPRKVAQSARDNRPRALPCANLTRVCETVRRRKAGDAEGEPLAARSVRVAEKAPAPQERQDVTALPKRSEAKAERERRRGVGGCRAAGGGGGRRRVVPSLVFSSPSI